LHHLIARGANAARLFPETLKFRHRTHLKIERRMNSTHLVQNERSSQARARFLWHIAEERRKNSVANPSAAWDCLAQDEHVICGWALHNVTCEPARGMV
jgi:hypothetical protein